LNAEDAASGKDIKKADSLYIKAITSSVRGGFLAVAGLANERYADLLLLVGNYHSERDAEHRRSSSRRVSNRLLTHEKERSTDDDDNEVRYRIKESIKYYTEWGAMKKVQVLRSTYKHILQHSPSLFIEEEK
jgi:hypothetical protein